MEKREQMPGFTNTKYNKYKIYRSYLIKILLVISLFSISIIMISPFLIMIITSLKTAAEVCEPVFSWIPKSWAFNNYLKALSYGMWGRWFFNSFIVTTIVTITSLFFNSLAGYAFSRLDFKGRDFLFLSMMISLMMPPQITMVPVFLIMKNIPLIGGNNIFGQGGTGLINTYGGLIINNLAGAFGVFLCRQFYLNFPRDLDDAAEVDGCGPFMRYFNIYLPLSKPLLASLGVLKLTATWNDYVWPLIITNSEEMRTVQLGLTIFKHEFVIWEQLMAATTLVSLPLIIIFLFAQRFFIHGLITSGLKG